MLKKEQREKSNKWKVFLLSFSILFFLVPQSNASSDDSRLGIFVKNEVTKGTIKKFYYKQIRVECWLDGQLVYDGAIKKGKLNVRIFYDQISPGKHSLKFRWKARIRGDEAARVKLGGRRVVDWVYVPQEEFAEYQFTTQAVETKVIEISVSREFGLLKNKEEIKFKEGIWKESLDDNKTRRIK